jgi:hypothetical protein
MGGECRRKAADSAEASASTKQPKASDVKDVKHENIDQLEHGRRALRTRRHLCARRRLVASEREQGDCARWPCRVRVGNTATLLPVGT